MSRFRADAEIAVQVLHENGGFSLTRDIQAANGQAYFAAYQGYEEQVGLDKFNADSILGFRRRNLQLLQESVSNLIGGWLHEGVVYLDLSRAFQDLQEALSFAQAHSQIAIWDGFNQKEIMVSDGRTGSEVGLIVAKLKAMFTHPILSEGLAEDDPYSVEGEDDPELGGWGGLLQSDLTQPAFAFAKTFPPGQTHNVRTADDFDWSNIEDDPEEDEEPVYKWVWNKDDGFLTWPADGKGGVPTHAQVVIQNWGRKLAPAKDWLGYAVVADGTVELDSWKSNCPYDAFAAAKQQFSNLFPGAQVLIPDYAIKADDDGASGSPDVPITSNRRAAQQWATAQFGMNVVPNAQPLLIRFGPFGLGGTSRSAATGPDLKGCMVALYIPQSVGEDLAVKGGEPVDDLHITLAYFEEKAEEREDWSKAIDIARAVALQHKPLSGTISGVGVFHSDEGDVLWAAPSVPGLAEFRTDLVEALNDGGFKISDTFGYQPHITLKYDFKGKPPRIGEEGHKLDFEAASFVVSEHRTGLPFASK